MQIKQSVLALLLALSLVVVACGGSDNDKGGILSGNQSNNTTTGADVAPTTAGQPPRPANGSQQQGPVDVCALFNADDAKAVVLATKSGPGTDTRFTAEKVQVPAGGPTLGSCKFQWRGTPTGTLQVLISQANNFGINKADGKPVPGIGDEAYSVRGATVVRVGQVVLSSGEDSFDQAFVQEVFKKIAPRLK